MINENVRFFKPNDPYYYEVDNMPIDDLIANCVSLQNEIDDIPSAEVFVTGDWINSFLQKSTYDSRTLGNITDVTSDPQPGFALVFENGAWTPKLLKGTLSSSFSNVNIDSPSVGQMLKKTSNQWQAEDVLIGATKLSDFTDIAHTAPNPWEAFGEGGWPYAPLTVPGLYSDGSPKTTGWTDCQQDGQFSQPNNFSPNKWSPTMHENSNYPPSKDNPYVTEQYATALLTGGGNNRASTMDDVANLSLIVSAMVDLDYASSYPTIAQGSPFEIENPRQEYLHLYPDKGSYKAQNGLHIQWARGTHIANYDFVMDLNWKYPFKNKCLGVHICKYGVDGRQALTPQIQSFDLYGARVRLQRHNDIESAMAGITAIGFGY